MLTKILKASLITLLFTIIFSQISQSFDGDFGWHLRFGRDAFQGNFQYNDSYTWGHYNLPWTNHEWAGDILYWLIYSQFGYYALVLLTSLVVFFAFYTMARFTEDKTTITGLIVSAIAVNVLSHILVMRLAMFSFLFFVILIIILEKIPRQKAYWLLPFVFWFWSVLHGSWILGFIILNIYWGGHILQNIIHRYWPRILPRSTWEKTDFYGLLGVELLSILTICINPYGTRVITEVSEYFTQSYFKSHITEWVPSYTYPVFWGALVFSTVVLFFAGMGMYYKKLNLAQFFLICFLYLSGLMYKRNAMFIVMIGIPIVITITNYALHKIKRSRQSFVDACKNTKVLNTAYVIGILTIICLIGFKAKDAKFYNDVWQQNELISNNTIPYNATEFLKKEINNQPTKIFNEFSWGGYFNWQLPTALVYFDGRGTATWMNPENNNETMLQTYYGIKFNDDGLKIINTKDVKYVILRNSHYINFFLPNRANQILFGNSINHLFKPESSRLEDDLNKSTEWTKIYEDSMANIWKKNN